jgi:LDH2 family malate/lactate/ureidoglycolate dehydrogenase
MLSGASPIDGANPVLAGSPAESTVVVLDEAVSPVAGRRFSRN